MGTMQIKSIVVVGMCALACGCASVPKAPTVRGSNRTPVNTVTQVELQSCKSDLSNTKVLLQETARLADSASTALSQMTARCAIPKPAPTALPATPAATFIPTALRATPAEPISNTVFVLQFPYASAEVNLTDESTISLGDAAKTAQLIVIRGRTDGVVETAGETRIAKERAHAVSQYLQALGVEPTRIRETFQPVGDNVADNSTDAGRAKNRRAEVEVYAVAPVQRSLTAKVIN